MLSRKEHGGTAFSSSEYEKRGISMLSFKKVTRFFSVQVFISVCLAVFGFFMVSTRIEAQAYHAQYDHSTSVANARLASGHPPATVQVWFTEQLEPDFSGLSVYDQSKQRVDENNSHIVTSYSMAISLRPHLPNGAYTVVYQNVSLDDEHHIVGAFSFVVGGGLLPTNTNALTGNTPQSLDANFNVWSITIRRLKYL
jgi:copper transport protein